MSTSKISNLAKQGYSVVFPLFLFFSAIFCMSTRTNNLLHLSILLLLLSLLRQDNRQALAEVLREQWQTWGGVGSVLRLLLPQQYLGAYAAAYRLTANTRRLSDFLPSADVDAPG